MVVTCAFPWSGNGWELGSTGDVEDCLDQQSDVGLPSR
jgi:hypothetical protein